MSDNTNDTVPATSAPLALLGGRKFILTMFVVVAAFTEREVGTIDSSTLVQLVSAALGFFSAANVIQKFRDTSTK